MVFKRYAGFTIVVGNIQINGSIACSLASNKTKSYEKLPNVNMYCDLSMCKGINMHKVYYQRINA